MSLVFAHQMSLKEQVAYEGFAANEQRAMSLNLNPLRLLERLERHPHSSRLAWLLFDMTRSDPTMRPRRRRYHV